MDKLTKQLYIDKKTFMEDEDAQSFQKEKDSMI